MPVTTVSIPTTEGEAWDLMTGDVSDLTAEQVRAAGLLIGGHRSGLRLPELYVSGDKAMRRAVIDVLSLPDPWNAQILTGMTWPYDQVAPELTPLREEVLTAVFGDVASLAGLLMESLISSQRGEDPPSPWYDIPVVVTAVDGGLTEATFSGTVTVVSDTGERSDYTVRAVLTDEFGWNVIDGSWLQLTDWQPAYAKIDRGPTLDVTDLSSLPDEVIAAYVAGDVILLDLDGSLLGHLPFFSLQYPRGGSAIVLVAPGGTRYGIDGALLAGYPLAGGAVIAPTASESTGLWSITSPDGETYEISGDWRVDATGRVITPSSSEGGLAYDVIAHQTVNIPSGCWVADATRPDWVLACDGDYRSPTIETLNGDVLVGNDEWRVVFEAAGWEWPLPHGGHLVGHWDGLIPFGDRWLGKWSGECESEDGFLVTDGALQPLGGANWEEAQSASVGGWTSDGRAVYSLHGPSTDCGQPAEAPGIYIVTPGGDPTLLWDSGGHPTGVTVWHRP